MSIIYEALKKVEGGKVFSGKIIRKKRFPTGFFLIAALVIVCSVFFTRYYLGKKQESSIPVANLPLEPLEPKEEILPVVSPGLPAGRQEPPQQKYQLSGIIFDQEKPFAIINGQVVKESDRIGNYSVESISQDKVELADLNDNSRLVLSLDSFQ